MLQNNLHVTLVQSDLNWENIPVNLEMFTRKLRTVSKTDLIILPEMFSTGFSMNTEKLAEEMSGTAVEWMKKTTAEKKCAVCGSIMIQERNEFFNRLVWMPANGEYKVYDKRHLFSLSNEPETYTAGKEKLLVELNGWKICPLVCYDLRFPVWSRNTKSDSYDLLIYVANWPERRNYAWKSLLVARAIENQSYVAGLNRMGNDGNGIYHSGDSMVIDAMGKILYHVENREDVFTIELSAEALNDTRKNLPFLKDADDFVMNEKPKIKSH